MPNKPVIYKSFLVRIWSDEANSKWRVMVTRISEASDPLYFSSLDDFMIFLLQEIEGPSKGGLPMV